MIAAVLALSIVIAPPAALPAGGGWHSGTARLRDAGCALCVQTESWASTLRYADDAYQLPPHRTMARMRPRDIVVHVTRAWEPSPPAWMLEHHPLRIVRTAISASFEGNTSHGRVSRWVGATWRAGSYVSVWVLFGSPSPTRAAIARAQAELDSARLAAWTIRR